MKKIAALFVTSVSLASSAFSQVAITGNYSQDFNSLGNGLPAGWGLYTNVSSTSLGSSTNFVNTNPAVALNTWSNTTGAFKNLASATGLTQVSTVAEQQASLDRALGLRPSAAFGDTNINFLSINFYFSTVGYEVTALSLDAMVLATEGRDKIWDIQYGLGASPTEWLTLGSLTSGSVWGTTAYSFSSLDFGTSLNNQSDVWFRFASTTLSTGAGSRPTVAIDNFEIQAVPEPSTYALLALAGAGLAGYTIRRRRR